MACINPNDPEFKKILKEVGGNPLLAAIEFNKLYPEEGAVESEVIKPGVQELFESNSELANAVYEALGVEVNNFKLQSNEKAFGEPHPEGANSYDIFYKGNKIGKIALFDGKNPMIKGLELNESERNKGLGKALYKWLNYKANLNGGTLYADQEFISPSAQRVWESLDKEGLIDLTGNTPKFNNQQKQQAQQIYSQYLDSIFPDSKVKDIVYHGSPNKFDNFKKGLEGNYVKNRVLNTFFFSEDKDRASKYGGDNTILYSVLLNSKNPYVQVFENPPIGFDNVTDQLIEKDFEELKNKNYDSWIGKDTLNDQDYVVFEPEQIHILGSEQDIEGFKEFMDKSTFKQLELDPEMSNYIADQISRAFNVPIPGMEKDTLITAEEIENFNRDVENRDGRLPSEYFTGIDDVNKWVLNKSELYDLVDKDTGEIYLKDVNLSTGQVEKQEVPSQPVPEKERQEAIDYINNSVKEFRLDEILAERGYDVNDIISNLASAENKEEFNKIINKLLRLLC
jgi:phage pi2 protein 07